MTSPVLANKTAGCASIILNGIRQPLQVSTLTALLTSLKHDQQQGVAVSINGVIIPRAKWHEKLLYDKDEIEVVSAVCGG